MSSDMEALSLDDGKNVFTEEERKVAMYGEKGQGEYLNDAKRRKWIRANF